jgi:hypothetical protein
MKRLGIIIFLSSVPTFAALPELEPAFNGQSRMVPIDTATASQAENAGTSTPSSLSSNENDPYTPDNASVESRLGMHHPLEDADENPSELFTPASLSLAEPTSPGAGQGRGNERSIFGRPNRGPNVGGFSSLGSGPSLQSGFGLSGGGAGLSGSTAGPGATVAQAQAETGTVYYLLYDGSQGETGTIYYYPTGGYGGSNGYGGGYGYGGSGYGYGGSYGYGGGYSADAAPEPSSLGLGLLCIGAFAGLMARFRPRFDQ